MPRRTTTILLLIAAALSVSACGYSAAAEENGDGPAKVESIEDSDVARIVLKASAAKRIGLETAPVAVGTVDSSLVVRGQVVGTPAAGTGSATVRVVIPAGQLANVDAEQPARILDGQEGLVAPPTTPPAGSGSSGARYYRLDGAGVHAGQRLRVRLALRGGGERKTVPYSAVIYWIDGGTWVYMRTGPLSFVRTPIEIDTVNGNVAVLRSGPPAGTQIVSVGGEELLGTEFQIEGE